MNSGNFRIILYIRGYCLCLYIREKAARGRPLAALLESYKCYDPILFYPNTTPNRPNSSSHTAIL